MGKLIAVKYRGISYPKGIKAKVEEVAGHFDVGQIRPKGDYSLHTEYSYGKRHFDKPIVRKCSAIIKANKDGIPMLWYDTEWAISFAQYIEELTREFPPPVMIEIHPPFSDYAKDIDGFLQTYQRFEERIRRVFPDTKIMLENRCGSMYRGSSFLITKAEDIGCLVKEIEARNLGLRITLDLPQLFSAHPNALLSEREMARMLNELKPVMRFIEGIHLWGKRRSRNGNVVAHVGDLESFFGYDLRLKQAFLQLLVDLLSDDIDRYLVVEVNSGNDDAASILRDLIQAGLSFV